MVTFIHPYVPKGSIKDHIYNVSTVCIFVLEGLREPYRRGGHKWDAASLTHTRFVHIIREMQFGGYYVNCTEFSPSENA